MQLMIKKQTNKERGREREREGERERDRERETERCCVTFSDLLPSSIRIVPVPLLISVGRVVWKCLPILFQQTTHQFANRTL